jgi:hypothetical protein
LSNIKKYYWLIPLIGGVISLIGFLIPAWYSPPVWIEYVWMIGIIHHVTGGNVIDIAPPEMFIPSLIATLLISLCSILAILNALFKFRGKTLLRNTDNLWLIIAIVEIGAAIFYIFGIQIGFFLNTDLEFVDYYVFQFGLFIPFIGAVLILTGSIMGKLSKKDK